MFGSSSVVGDIKDAIDQVFDAIEDIEKTNSNRLQLLEPSSLNRDFDAETAQQIKDIVIPKKGSNIVTKTAYGVFLGYTLGLDPNTYPTIQYQSVLNAKMDTDTRVGKSHLPYSPRRARAAKLLISLRASVHQKIPAARSERMPRGSLHSLLFSGYLVISIIF